ncbi:hypothetical protein [Jiangella mangrovi]|uniref:Uncharacterized protein n=1 Tax=Jiangella mangrovi TaxID=1524084 RepID=A0A7W9GTY6_9ACTN|nr:hypothetical protein [Jiangella mangrovi]MBB5789979.1 hypothetical protein [Jiangella mangrovi]
MTAVVVAMLAIVMVATAVLAAVGAYYHLAGSAAVQRRLRRWRFLAMTRMDDGREAAFHGLRMARRGLAKRLSRPAVDAGGRPAPRPAASPAPRLG